jgi:type I restriction enzyme S subunit
MQEKYKSMSNVPNLRFPGFTGEWEVKKLGEVASNKSGKYNPINAVDSIKCVEMEHLATETGQLLGYTDGSKSGSIKNVFNEGDVLFGKLRPYLKKYLQAPFDGVCSSEIWVLKGKNISNDFLYRIIQTNSFIDLANQSSGSKMPRADWNVVENGLFSIPSLPEQQKIATFLSLIDERIQTQNKIIEQLKSLIDGLSEKLFTQKLKFKDENDNVFSGWEVKKLQEVLSKYEEKTTSNNQYPILTSARTGIHFQKDYFNDNEVASKDNTGYNIVPKGYFTYRHMSDDITFKFNINTICKKGIVSTLYPVFTTVGLDDYFFKTYLNKGQEFKNYALMQKQGGSRTYMYFTKLIQLELAFPCLDEQIKITNFLSQIDKKIELEKRLLVQYENQKKYLLQNLFV